MSQLPGRGSLVGAANQGAMKVALAALRNWGSNLFGGALLESVAPPPFTLQSGLLSVSQNYGIGGFINVSRAAGLAGAFNLDGIDPTNFQPGQIIGVGTAAGKPMTLRNQVAGIARGQLVLRGAANVTLTDQESCLLLRLEAAAGPWREIMRSGSALGAPGLAGLNLRTITGAGNYLKPSNLAALLLVVIGAGGGGAGKPATTRTSLTITAGGGGAGGLAVKMFDAGDLPASCAIRVGAKGAGGQDATRYSAGNQLAVLAQGTTGGNTTFVGTGITNITAGGGAGGPALVRGRSGLGLQVGAAGHEATAGGGTASGGDINIVGASGDPGIAMDIDDRTRKHNCIGGRGGAAPFATAPAIPINANANNYPAGSFGGGGNGPSGDTDSYVSSYRGGDGAPGAVLALEFLN